MFSKRTGWELEPSRLSEELARHRAAGKPLLDLTVSNPTACGFEYDGEAILRALATPAALLYEPAPRGLRSARGAVAAYYAERGVEVPPESIVLTTGTSEAYAHVLRLVCDPGDEVLVPAPSYPLLGFLADLGDVSLVSYPLVYEGGWRMDFSALARALTPRARAIVVVHPNNPTGHYCGPEDARRLAKLGAERGLAIVADEVFLDFALEAPAGESFAACQDALTFTLSGISKIAGLPQMKAAWMVASGPEPARSQALDRLEVIADTFLSVSTPVQQAMAAFLRFGSDFERQVSARARANLAELDRQLARRASWARLRVEGGWYAVLRAAFGRSGEDVAIELLRSRNVYIHPGHLYDFPGEGYFVVSLLAREHDFAEGLRRLFSLS